MNDSVTLPDADLPDLLPGWVWLCGAGPGDPGLVTLHTLNALRQADVIVVDALVNPAILDWAHPGATIIQAGKRGGRPSPKQRDISLKLVELARAHNRVVRLKGGDPFVFGRGGEEAQTLIQHGVPIRIVPGISAGIGGLAYAGIPVTHRDVNSAVTFVTGHNAQGSNLPAQDWAAISRASPVIVIYMGMKHIDQIARDLMAAGRSKDEPVAVVTNATTAQQRVLETTLERAADECRTADLSPPALICIGRVVLLRQALGWQSMLAGVAPRDTDPLQSGQTVENK